VSANLKTIFLICAGLFVGLVLLVVLGVLSLGYWPKVGQKLGFGQVQDLGVTYTNDDYTSVMNKVTEAWDERVIQNTFTESELSALVNECSQAVCILNNAQVKTSADGSLEIAGTLDRDDAIQLFTELSTSSGDTTNEIAGLAKLLPAQPTVYLEAKVSGDNDQVSFDLTRVSLAGVNIQGEDLSRLDEQIQQAIADALTNAGGTQLQTLQIRDDGIYLEADLQELNTDYLK
jgi:hypothetical protein